MERLPQDRIARAQCALEGLSVGDAFGERFFRHKTALVRLWLRGDGNIRDLEDQLGSPPWHWTDDTALATSIVNVLRECEKIDQEKLAYEFAIQYAAEPRRGYGPAMHRLLPQLRRSKAWQSAPSGLFSNQGSFGNGAAMRVAPVGAYFADDLDAVVEQARRSAVVTHAHPEGVAGAIAVAVAAALAWPTRESAKLSPQEFLDRVLASTPESEVAAKIRLARDLTPDTTIQNAVAILGNGSQVTAPDTVPFVLWSAVHHLDNYEEALWATVSGLGDMDTTCAMVGGIVVMYTGLGGIPIRWRQNREVLPGA
jgi:ADP-ribosylglycohydrolase